jgi:hypothetical protein
LKSRRDISRKAYTGEIFPGDIARKNRRFRQSRTSERKYEENSWGNIQRS